MNYLKMSFSIIVCILLISLTSCKKEIDEEKLFKEIYQNMQTQYNFNYKLDINKKSNTEVENIKYIMYFDMISENEGTIEYQKNLGFKTLDGFYQYNGENATHFSRDCGSWTKKTESMSNIDNDMLFYDYFYEVLNDYNSYKKIGTETLSDEAKVTEYKLTKDSSKLIEIVLGPDFDELNLTEQELSDVTKDVDYYVYLDLEEKLIRKIDLDLSDILTTIIDKAKEKDSTVDLNINEIDANVEFNYFGEINITIPENVKQEAVDIS